MRKKTIIGVVLCLLLLHVVMGSAWADKQIVMTFLGDCTIGGEDRLLGKEFSFAALMEGEGYGYYFRNVKDLLEQDDLTVANLECVLRDDSSGSTDKTYVFRGDAEFAQILALGSVEAVNLENNHTMDFYTAGKEDTVRALEDAGIASFDMDTTYIYEKDGIRIAFLGLHRPNYFSKGDAFVEKIEQLEADDSINAIVVSLHFGEEYCFEHNNGQTKMAYRMIDAGADLVIGHHPHVLQGMEVYENKLILYSLGNFVFGGNAEVRSMQTIIPRITMLFSDDGELLGSQMRIYPAHISGDNSGGEYDNNYQPVTVEGEEAQAVYALLDQDSLEETAPVLDIETDTYRDYRWIYVNPQ